MERVEYDPEIDPSIREKREAAERDRELADRIRIEIERYVAEADLVPRQKSEGADPPQAETHQEQEQEQPRRGRQRQRREGETQPNEHHAAKTERRKARRKALASLFTGSILTSQRVRRMWPWMLGIAAVMVLYIANTFQLQKLHLEHQKLRKEVRELSVRALGMSAEKAAETRRSAIVERLKRKNIPLEEFPNPVKRIEKR